MVTKNQAGIERKDEVIIVRVGKIITNPRMELTMIDRIITLVREIKKNGRLSFLVNFVNMIILPTYVPKLRRNRGSFHNFLLC
jgi:hypothetical protein